jgi:hypothetical protein
MTTAIPRSPDSLLDGKTFTFNQYIPVAFPSSIPLGESILIGFNASVNGYEY